MLIEHSLVSMCAGPRDATAMGRSYGGAPRAHWCAHLSRVSHA